MRVPLLPPCKLDPEQKPLCEDMNAGVVSNFKASKAVAADGALAGAGQTALVHENALDFYR